MNIFFPPHQERLFFIMLIFGMICAAFYDTFCVKRRIFSKKDSGFILFIDDFCFAVISTFLFLITTFVFNNGIIRWYEFLFTFLGFAIYKLTISKLILVICFLFCDLLRTVLIRIIRILFLPLAKSIHFMLEALKPLVFKLYRIKAANKIYRYYRNSI